VSGIIREDFSIRKTSVPLSPVIAIDGPVASGKTVVGKAVAENLGYRFVDTGVMYRAVTWLVLERGVQPEDGNAVSKVIAGATVDVVADGQQRVMINGTDVTEYLTKPHVEAAVSFVSRVPAVREAMVTQQQRMAAEGRVVMVGRDIGTNVLTDAPLKVFLSASKKERVRRRHKEAHAAGRNLTVEDVAENLEQRDTIDSQRDLAPLRAAEDAVPLVTDGLSVEQVVMRILELAGAR
jgi:cytidylate kinase